jgi:hypothetical protein
MTEAEAIIEHLRLMIKEMQNKLEYRSQMLASLLPIIEALHREGDSEIEYTVGPDAAIEFTMRYSEAIIRFNEEFAKEAHSLNFLSDKKS